MSLSIAIRNREERKTLNEACLWCLDKKTAVQTGTVVNESASGILLHTNSPLKLGDTLFLLTSCFGEPLSHETISSRQLIQYPVTRKGTVVRVAGQSEFGIHFETENKPAEFRRWYRENSTIYMLLTKSVAVIVLEGVINLETSALLQSLVNTCKRQVSEFVFSLEKITAFVGAAATVLKTTIKHSCTGQLTATVIYNNDFDKAKQLADDIQEVRFFGLNTMSTYDLYSNQPPDTHDLDSYMPHDSTTADVNEEQRFLVVTSKKAIHTRLSLPISDRGGNVIAVMYMHEALNKIIEYEHHCVVIDLEIEDLNLLLLFNQLISKNLHHFPSLIIVGPKHVDKIVMTALKLPVHTYLSKPYSEKDYVGVIESIMKEHNPA